MVVKDAVCESTKCPNSVLQRELTRNTATVTNVNGPEATDCIRFHREYLFFLQPKPHNAMRIHEFVMAHILYDGFSSMNKQIHADLSDSGVL